MKLKVGYSVGGGGGAVAIISNSILLNGTSGATALLAQTAGSMVGWLTLYSKFRVTGCDLYVRAYGKFTTSTVILSLPTVEGTSPSSTLADMVINSVTPHAHLTGVSAVTAGKPCQDWRINLPTFEAIFGTPDLYTDEDYAGTSGADPVKLAYLYLNSAPIAGSFTANTDPFYTITGTLTVEMFDRQTQ
jgi:hypothetical protein